MEEFRFHSPNYLLILLALPIVWFALGQIKRHTQKLLERFAVPQSLKILLRTQKNAAQPIIQSAFWIGLCLLILALARPQGNPSIEERETAGLDIMLLLDVSKSMDAEDMPPSRLKKAKKTINTLLNQLAGDRVGIVSFAGSAVLTTPLTTDYDVIRSTLQNVDTNMIENQGTNIPQALEMAEKAMERGAQSQSSHENRTYVFIILSDGEDHYGGTYNTIQDIKAKGGIIFTIVFGTEKGGPIPIRNDRGELQGHKRDRGGNPVITKINPEALRKIAELGGGNFYYSTFEEGEVTDLLNRTKNLQRTGNSAVQTRVYEEYFYPLLITGVALLFLSLFAPMLSFRKPGFLIILFLFFGSKTYAGSPFWDKDKNASEKSKGLAAEGKPEEAANELKPLLAENPNADYLNYNMGTHLLNAKKFQEGREQLSRIPKGDPLWSMAQFNIAGSHALAEEKEDAKAKYAELITDLRARKPLSRGDAEILKQSLFNLQHLVEEQQKNQNQSGGNENKDSKEQEKNEKNKQDKKDGKSQDKQDKKDQKEDKKDEKKEDKKENPKSDEEKKQEQEKEQKKDQNQVNKQPQQYKRGQFKERENMSEQDAKRILEALRQQESNTQKKLLKMMSKDSKVENNGKDW